ncbi:MAG: class I SAM-dependent methyltransferase [Bacteroidota bacterium]
MEQPQLSLHWENIYQTKALTEVSWYQEVPDTSLQLIQQLQLPFSAKIIDICGGDSLLVDHLLMLGYTDITVLDISATAIEKAKQRLGEKWKSVKWIITDITKFDPTEKYDVWHDRAAFHFLSHDLLVEKYVAIANQFIQPGGFLVLGTFAENGPKKCSGLDIRQYSEENMSLLFQDGFQKIDCFEIGHHTPSNSVQQFQFCTFKKR